MDANATTEQMGYVRQTRDYPDLASAHRHSDNPCAADRIWTGLNLRVADRAPNTQSRKPTSVELQHRTGQTNIPNPQTSDGSLAPQEWLPFAFPSHTPTSNHLRRSPSNEPPGTRREIAKLGGEDGAQEGLSPQL